MGLLLEQPSSSPASPSSQLRAARPAPPPTNGEAGAQAPERRGIAQRTGAQHSQRAQRGARGPRNQPGQPVALQLEVEGDEERRGCHAGYEPGALVGSGLHQGHSGLRAAGQAGRAGSGRLSAGAAQRIAGPRPGSEAGSAGHACNPEVAAERWEPSAGWVGQLGSASAHPPAAPA